MERRILQLGQALEQAAEAENWDEIRRLDAEIAGLLRSLRQQGSQHRLHQELAQLQRSHRRVVKICQEQHDLLEMKIRQHQKSRQGLQAYALFSSDREDRG